MFALAFRRWMFAFSLLLLGSSPAAAQDPTGTLDPSAQPMPGAWAALQSDAQVQVTDTPLWYAFEPVAAAAGTGFVFYPGGKVHPAAYAPLARAIANAGYVAVIVKFPQDLALLAPDQADLVRAAYALEVPRWVIGGHSLGGVVAATYAWSHPDMSGLVLLASYPLDQNDLSERDIEVTSLRGEHDGLTTYEDVDSRRHLLPPDTTYIGIAGGNHAYFGYYGEQAGDGAATITREAQQAATRSAILSVLAAIEPG